MSSPQHDASDFSFPPWTLRDKLSVALLGLLLAASGTWIAWVGWQAALERQDREREEQRQEMREGGK